MTTTNTIPDGFVRLPEAVPDAFLEIRYYSTYNFVGERIDGYEQPTALLTVEAARVLKAVSDDVMAQGYRLKVFDAYRPQRAISHFMNWARDVADTRMKPFFYPNVDKADLFARGYLAEKSGHSRGSTVDLTLCDRTTGEEVDMGGTFDWFGKESHPDWCGNPETQEYTGEYLGDTQPSGGKINEAQFRNRMMLRTVMMRHGFKPFDMEWWHFTLVNEPYPETYFDYPAQ